MTQLIAWLPRIAGALTLVAFAAGISRWQKLDLERSMLIAVTRAFVQLIAIGYALDLIFNSENPLWIAFIISIMIAVAGRTAGQRGKIAQRGKTIATLAIGGSALLVLTTLITLRVFAFQARFIIPISGMIIGNAMTATGLTMARLRDDIRIQRPQIETALALGATSRQAVSHHLKTALMTGMTPIIDNTKTVGLISLPGAMTGMILAGASPLEAVQLQIVVMYMLIGAAAFASLITTFLTYRQFFTPVHQLR
jgi:putative ABC transport system permease protein